MVRQIKSIVSAPLNWLLVLVPFAVYLELTHSSGLLLFAVSGIAIIPLAGLMGRATESLAASTGAAVGALLNSTFGNAAELIIALMILKKGPAMYPLVKASITGSIIGNVLLVLGLALIAGGMKKSTLKFNQTAAGMGATLLALASVGLILPTVYYYISKASVLESQRRIEYLSEEISIILLVIYVLSLVFTLVTHKNFFTGEEEESAAHAPEWTRGFSVSVLVLATLGVAGMSECLVGSVEHAAETLGMSQVFIGVIVVAVVGNAAEHSTAVLVAMKNKMDLAVQIAVGSSIQIALLVAPILVFASLAMGHPHALDLHFTPMELIAIVLSIGILSMVCQDGESHWMEGVMLVGVYLMLALAFYHLPT